jgi:hypothetical protein
MYQALEPVVGDLLNLKETLSSLTSHARVARILTALDSVANRLNGEIQTAPSAQDAAQLRTLYRGFISAGRLVQNMHELRTQAEPD